MRTLACVFLLETLVNLLFFLSVFRYIIHLCSVAFPASSVLILLTVEVKTYYPNQNSNGQAEARFTTDF